MDLSKRQPFFTFPDIKPTDNFSFEKLSSANFQQLCLLFENDDNLFTDERFKSYEGAQFYTQDRETHAAFSAKHAGQDWLFLYDRAYAGILHLYDLSHETFAENNRRCWIGFAIKPTLRNKGVTKKAVEIFRQYIFDNFPQIKYIYAITEMDNLASQVLLCVLGFEKDCAEYLSKEHMFYRYVRPGQ